MTTTNRTMAAALMIVVLAVVSARAGDEPGRDLAPILPVGQGRIFDNRYYGGPYGGGPYGPGGNPFALSPDGKYALSSTGNALMVHELSKGGAPRQGRMLQAENAQFYGRPAIAFSADGKTIAATTSNYPDFNIRFWDLASGKETRQIDNDQQFASLALSPDGKLLALGTNQKIEIWDAATTDDIRSLQAPQTQSYQALAFSTDGRMLAGSGNTSVIQVWEVASGRERAVLQMNPGAPPANPNVPGFQPQVTNVSALAFSADGALVAAGGTDNAVRLWNLRTGQELPPLVGHQGQVTSLVFTTDGRRLLSLDMQGLKLEWDVRRLNKATTGKLRPPSDEEIADLWETLAEADPFQTYRAVHWMAADPKRAIAFLQKRLEPVPSKNADTVARLAGELQSPDGSVRRKAMAGLRQHGEAGLGALLQMAQNPMGFNQNVSMMITRLDRIYNTPERQRTVKAVGVLEKIGTDEAKQLLEKLSKGAAGTRLTVAAKTSLDRLKSRPAKGQDLSGEPKALWEELAGSDAGKAFRAVVRLASQPDTSLPWLRENLKPIPVPDPKRLDELVTDLDSADFTTRHRAMTELEKLGETTGPTLKKALASQVSLEVRKRIEQLLQKLDGKNVSTSQLQQARALEVLEQIGTTPARQLLRELAQGAPAARLTGDARAGLARLEKRANP